MGEASRSIAKKKARVGRPYGFGIVGCGMVAEFHAKAIEAMPNARLVAVADKILPSAERMAQAHGCQCADTIEQLLKRKDVEVVCVCTPSGSHAEVALQAALEGKHLIVEKPLEVTLAKVDAMIEASHAAGVQLAGIFPSRFLPANRLTKEAVEKGRFGRLTMGSAHVKWYRTQDYYDRGGWRGTWALDGGGALMNQSIHAIDLLHWLMGRVQKVQAFTATLAHGRIEVEDTAVACLEFANGALGIVEGATSVYPGFFKRLEISGDRGTAIVEEETLKCWKFADETEEDERIRRELGTATETGGGASDPGAISFRNHQAQIEEFLQAIEEGRPSFVDGGEARKAVEIVLAIYQSSRLGRPVSLPL